jgi:hypothetical protein
MVVHALLLSLVLCLADTPNVQLGPYEDSLWPKATDLKRFPGYIECGHATDLSKEFQRWCQTHQQLEPSKFEYYEVLRLDAIWRQNVWELLEDCWRHYDEEGQRRCLQRLREEIGDEAYFFSYMPHPLPIWAFVRD